MDLLDIPIEQLARELPGATTIFNRHSVQYCCGGAHTLREAIPASDPKQQLLLNELQALLAQTNTDHQDWQQRSDSELIDHLLSRYHEVHRKQLSELVYLANRVETTHWDHPQCPHGLTEHLHAMASELEQHMQKEEMILFPMLSRGQGVMAGGPIRVMRHEHDEHAAAIARIDQLTDNINTPEDACNSWHALYTGLQTFKNDLQRHIQLENDVLFARYQAA